MRWRWQGSGAVSPAGSPRHDLTVRFLAVCCAGPRWVDGCATGLQCSTRQPRSRRACAQSKASGCDLTVISGAASPKESPQLNIAAHRHPATLPLALLPHSPHTCTAMLPAPLTLALLHLSHPHCCTSSRCCMDTCVRSYCPPSPAQLTHSLSHCRPFSRTHCCPPRSPSHCMLQLLCAT